MKVVFAGPSVFGATIDWGGIERRPPAAQGDLFAAVAEGADAIGLIDGLFAATAAVWHKEILFALQQGVRVVGGASMGALRAAECRLFGMEPVGVIALAYAEGSIDDDSLVAVTHGPAELDYVPLTVALVDMLATFDRMAAGAILDSDCLDRLCETARATYFEERTLDEVVRRSGLGGRGIEVAYRQAAVSQKQQDALAVIERVRALPSGRTLPPAWRMETPPAWRAFAAGARGPARSA